MKHIGLLSCTSPCRSMSLLLDTSVDCLLVTTLTESACILFLNTGGN